MTIFIQVQGRRNMTGRPNYSAGPSKEEKRWRNIEVWLLNMQLLCQKSLLARPERP